MNRIIAHPAGDQLKACSDILSCTRSRTSGSTLVFPTLTLVRAILLQAVSGRNNCSSIQIQLSILHFHPQALSSLFGNFHWKIAFFMSYSAAGFLWTRILYLPLDPSFEAKATQKSSFCLTAVISLANQINSTILIRIVISLF